MAGMEVAVKLIAHSEADMPRIGKAIRAQLEAGPVRVTVEAHKPNRTLEQNSRIWALMTEISKQAPSAMGGEWHAPESWYEYCARRFGGVSAGPFGTPIRDHPSGYDKEKFSNWMTEVEAWAAEELGVQFSVTRAA